MIRGCLAQILTWLIIGSLILWVLRNPESVAALIGSGIDLAIGGGDSIGRLVTALTSEINSAF